MSRLFKKEIEYHIETEKLKQRLESMEDWSEDGVYQAVDNTNITYIDIKMLDRFLKKYGAKGINIEDNAAIIRRLDLDNDGRLNREEFLKGMQAQEPYSRMLIRNAIKKEETFGKVDNKAIVDKANAKDLKAIKKHKEDLSNQLAKV